MAITPEIKATLFKLVLSSLYEPATGIAEAAKSCVIGFARTKGGHALLLEEGGIASLLTQGLEQPDGVVRVRFMVALAELCNLSEELFILLEPQVASTIQAILKEEDLLIKLNMVELIPLIAGSPQGRHLMKSLDFFRQYL